MNVKDSTGTYLALGCRTLAEGALVRRAVPVFVAPSGAHVTRTWEGYWVPLSYSAQDRAYRYA